MLYLLIFAVSLLVLLVLYLLFIYKPAAKQDAFLEGGEINKKFYDFRQEEKDETVEAVLSINGKDFFFNYKKKDAANVTAIIKFTKNSLVIMRSSKYKDIIDSRFNEILVKLKNLLEISSLDELKYGEIIEEIRNYYK